MGSWVEGAPPASRAMRWVGERGWGTGGGRYRQKHPLAAPKAQSSQAPCTPQARILTTERAMEKGSLLDLEASSEVRSAKADTAPTPSLAAARCPC